MPPGNHASSDREERTSALSRRKWLGALGVAGAAGLAGCGGDGGDGTEGGDGGDGGGGGTTAMDTDTQMDDSTATPTPTTAEGFNEETEQATTITTVEESELPEVGGTYASAISSSINTLNHIYNTEATAGSLIGYTLDATYGFKPGQIQFPRWVSLSSDDAQVYTASLRENLRWSEPYGELTAEDFVYNIKKVHQSDWANSSAQSDWKEGGENIPVSKTGKYEFQIELSDIDPSYPKRPGMWGMQVAPKSLIKSYVENQDVEGLKKDEDLLNLNYTGNLGPYKLETWERQKRFVYKRNEDYYLREIDGIKPAFSKAPYFDELTVQIIKEESARLGALKAGELDTASIPPSKAAEFKDRDDTYLSVTPQPYITPINYNYRANGWEPIRNKKVRQAIAAATDKKKIAKGIFRNYANVAFTWQPRWSPWYDGSQVTKWGVGENQGKEVAMSLMKEGVSDMDIGYNGDTLLDENGEQVELSIYYQGSQQTEVDHAQLLAQMFQQNLGIKLDLQSIDGTTFVRNYWRQQVPENASELEWSNGAYNAGPRDKATSAEAWDLSLVFALNTYPMTPSTSEIFFQKDSFYNPWGFYPSYDFKSLFSKAKKEPDRDKRKEIYAEIFGKISDDQPLGMVAMQSDIGGYRNNVNGPIEDFFSGWDFGTWYKGDN